MKALSLLLTVLLAATTLAGFVPVSNYNLNQIQGTWYIQSIYDTTHNDWSLAYCYEITFDVLNDSAVNMTMTGFDGFRNHLNDDSTIIIPNSENPAILCQDSKCEYPLMVLNTSTLPYWIDGEVNTTIFAFDYGKGVIVLGGSRAYDTRYDMRPYLASLGLTINSTIDFWFVNSACDTHFGWNPLKKFNQTSLLQNFSLIAVYDPAGTGLVPWYTGNGIFDWTQAYCAGVSFQPGKGFDFKMTLSLNSLYQGEFMRSWQVMPTPDLNAALMGFGNTLLYVQYSDAFGNLVLTTGTSTSFLLSTSAKSYSLAEKTIFELTLKTMGTTVDLDYVYPIDNTSC